MTKPRLPIGIRTFRELRERSCYYVDKTGFIRRLLDSGERYFLARPRQFGKSLLLDTMKELFEGNEPLFKSLHIHRHWDWSIRHPVLRLSFTDGTFEDKDRLNANLLEQLDRVQRRSGIVSEYSTAPDRFSHVIQELHGRTGQGVAVLIDDCDKPILDLLEQPEAARAIRDFLHGFYGAIKDCDAHIRFAFLTGVSRCSSASPFSGLNNLNDITLDSRYSAICGYTDSDLDAVFGPELRGLDRDEIRVRYNGYRWTGEDKLYNPFDILMLFDRREFGSYWFEAASPAYPIRTLIDRGVGSPDLEEMLCDPHLLSQFDLEDIATEALLFLTGYLTITGERNFGGNTLYRLGYPNREVKQGLNRHLSRAMGSGASRLVPGRVGAATVRQ